MQSLEKLEMLGAKVGCNFGFASEADEYKAHDGVYVPEEIHNAWINGHHFVNAGVFDERELAAALDEMVGGTAQPTTGTEFIRERFETVV